MIADELLRLDCCGLVIAVGLLLTDLLRMDCCG